MIRIAFWLLLPALFAGTVSAQPALTTLQPGAFRNISQTLDINVVFVGYEPGTGPRDIDESKYRSHLPQTYRPIHRDGLLYGLTQYVGLTFGYNYRVTYTDAAWENRFFTYLGGIATPQARTFYQDAYNDQPPRTATIGQNHWIDATLVEKWLAGNAPAGVDTRKYTVFFINSWGRPDFKYHVYVKTDEPDLETGFNFGLVRDSRKLIAWGGTTPDDPQSGLGALGVRRLWFCDLSAGPEYWAGNYNIVDADVDGDGAPDYRIPPVWEYGNPNTKALYRAFDDLSTDLAMVTRFVAINLLFTASPLYNPALSPPKLPQNIQVDISVYEGLPGFDAKAKLQPARISQALGALQPGNTFTTQITDVPFQGDAMKTYLCFAFGPSCFGQRLFGINFGDLFLYHHDHLNQFLEGDADYEVPVFSFNTTDSIANGAVQGFADDNWSNATQSFVFQFNWPAIRDLGYGNSGVIIHEVGHHLGLSHPHDGFDYESGTDYYATARFYFAWLGDEANSAMNYLSVTNDFSQFDLDNMSRYRVANYINQANQLLGSILASPRAPAAYATIASADTDAAAALSLYGSMDYSQASLRAQSAYRKILAAAGQANVKVENQAWPADYKAKGRSPKFVDTLDYHRIMR